MTWLAAYQTTPALIRQILRSSAQPEGGRRGQDTGTRRCAGYRLGSLRIAGVGCRRLPSAAMAVLAPTPFWMRLRWWVAAGSGLALFEPQASLARPPPTPASAGCPQRSGGSQTAGSPFFCLRFFGEAKKSRSPAGAIPGRQRK